MGTGLEQTALESIHPAAVDIAGQTQMGDLEVASRLQDFAVAIQADEHPFASQQVTLPAQGVAAHRTGFFSEDKRAKDFEATAELLERTRLRVAHHQPLGDRLPGGQLREAPVVDPRRVSRRGRANRPMHRPEPVCFLHPPFGLKPARRVQDLNVQRRRHLNPVLIIRRPGRKPVHTQGEVRPSRRIGGSGP